MGFSRIIPSSQDLEKLASGATFAARSRGAPAQVVHKKVIYNIGAEILLATSPMHNSALVAQFSDVICFSGILSTRRNFLARSQACRTSILMSFCKNTAQDSWHHFKHMLKKSNFSIFSKRNICWPHVQNHSKKLPICSNLKIFKNFKNLKFSIFNINF